MNKYCIHQGYTIKEALDRIDASKNRVAVVLNDSEKVIGVVSQGDIIRALCSGKSIFARVRDIVQPSFLYLNSRDYEAAYKLFRKKKVTLLPIVNEDFELIDVITLDDIYDYLETRR